jgi:hypothetical protein
MLFHVSEDSGIRLFVPRPSPSTAQPVVWAVDDAHLRNYLLPRDCPRVTFAAGPSANPVDVARFLTDNRPVVAIEAAWLERARRTPLACYGFPTATFELQDVSAGYFVSHQPVVPEHIEIIAHPLDQLRARGVELRVVANLWALHDEIAGSTLEFSMIRMRLAQARRA